MKKYSLKADPRAIVGRKVKHLREAGTVPATIYGKSVKSTSIQVPVDVFGKLYQQTGETGLIDLSLAGETRPVLVHTVQTHPVNGQILHVEFHQVDLKEKVKANVPVVIVGQAAALVDKKGVLLTILDEVEVEALPGDLPEKIELDVSILSEVDQELKVKDLKVPSGVTILSDPEQTLVKIGELISREAEAQAAEEAAKAAEAAAAQAAEVPAAEGVPEGEAPQEAPSPSEKEVVAEKSDTGQEK